MMRIFLLLAAYYLIVFSHNPNCDYYYNIQDGEIITINSYDYPETNSAGIASRWTAKCLNASCQANCIDNTLEWSLQRCSMNKQLISRSGDHDFSKGATTFCGPGDVFITSIEDTLSIGMVTTPNSTGSFTCQIAVDTSPSNQVKFRYHSSKVKFPIMVALFSLNDYQLQCGAVVIASRYALTAAQCVVNQNFRNLGILVGEKTTAVNSKDAKIYLVTKITIHPKYRPDVNDYDIAVILTSIEVAFWTRFKPVCLPSADMALETFENKKVVITGWGMLLHQGVKPNHFKRTIANVLSDKDCRASGDSPTPRQICTITRSKKACEHDAGAPVLYSNAKNKVPYVVGIVSNGRNCGQHLPDLNTRITAVLDFIKENTPRADIPKYCNIKKQKKQNKTKPKQN